MVYALQTGVLYGPLQSRRFGRSLGINLSPCRSKLCSFNCVYCQYGPTERLTTDVTEHVGDLPSAALVLEAVEGALRSQEKLESVLLSGNGEPTLHPEFTAVARGVAELVERWQPDARTVLLSNSSGVARSGVRDALAGIELLVFKLDAGTRETFLALNRPADGVRFEEIVDELSALQGITLQTLLIEGEPGNTSPHELDAYFELVRWIAPEAVQLYSTDRPVARSATHRAAPERLHEVARLGRERTGMTFRVYAA
jgi:wyosine [tRNA(Phe)-imidazoG37] synthetase (radical SAM superfamily)